MAYSREIADQVCQALGEGLTLSEFCRDQRAQDPQFPSPSTIRRWVIDDEDGFAARYARAREALVQHWADEINAIADDGSNDWIERKNKRGELETVLDREHIERSKLRIDTRKWLMSKLVPHTYGDKVAHEHSGTLTLEQLITQATVQVIEPPKPPEIPGRVIDVEDGE